MTTKSNVLEALEKNRGSFISGADLAKQCGVSRNAVWKAITELKKDGYEIASVSNKGYSLSECSDIISGEGISLYLDEKLGCNVIVFDEIDSTNTEAKRMLISDGSSLLHGTVIIARTQTSGRGHEGKGFDSPEGGIYLSVILEPKKYKKKNVTEHVSKAVKKSLEDSLGMNLTVKKHSALYQGRTKICGILSEGILDLETGIYSNYIIGIGIRTDSLKQSAPITRNELIAKVVTGILS